MRLKPYIYIAAMAAISACNTVPLPPAFTVGEAVDEIVLHAGVSNGSEGIATKATDNHHANHVNFTSGTQLRLRVDGTWNGTVSKTTTGTTGAQAGRDNLHNHVSFSTASSPVEQLYWDDYGTADPSNTTGRNAGLTIYGVAVNGLASAPAVSSWTEHEWNVGAPASGSIDQTGGWAAKDLLTSNNITSAADGTYKFDAYVLDLKNSTSTASNLIEFTHAMTEITVNLTAGEGFPGYTSGTPTNAKFQTAPTVKLLGFNYTGKVNVEAKTSTPTAETTADVKMHLAEGGASNNKAKFDALVFPGNTFTATIGSDANNTPTSATNILELNADGNIYKVTAAQLVKAIAGVGTTDTPVNGTLEQAKNYILNITVNKTRIVVTATIKEWEDVDTETVQPKINVESTYGYTVAQGGTGVSAFTKDYDLFRSTTKATGYDEDGSIDGIQYAARYTSSSSSWNKAIYWPDHQTHYFFRGVYPQVGTAVSGTSALPTEAVTTVSSNDVVAVANATYTSGTYPSDLAIAIPRNSDGTYDETCKGTGHAATAGICATEGTINLNFEYSMSKVEVRLKSSANDASHIAMTKDNTTVEIIGAYSKARIKLSDGLHDSYADADKGNYTLSNLGTPESGSLVTTRDAVVPQEIGDAVIFRITFTNDNGTPSDSSDDTTDVYETKVKLIKDSTNNPVVEWVHGKHYIYVLDVNKTEINTTATIKDWVTVNAEEDIWF